MKKNWMAWAFIVSAALTIIGSSVGEELMWVHYVFKPVTTMLAWWMAARVADPINPPYRRAILSALLMSLAGDVFLMLPKSVTALGFELGLASFLIAHLFFLRAFTRDAPLFGKRWPLLLLLLVSCVNLVVLWPTIAPALHLPVLVYMLCLVCMSAQAISRAMSLRNRGSTLAAVGGAAFLISDSTLAYNKFHAPIPASAVLVLGTYYAALYLIASSVKKN